jgi:imidazolonepropionase-like amidohydrolase
MRATLACLAAVLALASLSTHGQDEARYTVLIMSKHAGLQTTSVSADGTRRYTFEYNDRGRGPKLESTMRLNEAGVPVSVQTSGNDYFKAPVSEKFTLANGKAQWQNDAERGERAIQGPAFYVSLQSVPEEPALLAVALLKAPNQRLPVLPEGEASLRRTGDATVRKGSESKRIVAYEIAGLGFTPFTIWLDEKNRFFAGVSSWQSTVLEGWESSVPQLLAQQEAAQGKRTLEIARSLARKPGKPVAITNANLFDANTGRSQPGSTVVIDGARIRAVGKTGEVEVPANAETIDARGRALLPGLWDMHVHVSPDDGVMHMAAGVTSVRDLANDNDALMAIKKKIEQGEAIGPRITMRGFMDGRGPYAGPTKVFVDTEAEARKAIDDYARLGYEGIKIYSSIKPELVPTIVRLAHEKGLRVSGHVPAFMTARQFVEAGADELQHVNFLFLNFFFDEVKDTRTPARFTSVAERAAKLDLGSPEVREFIQLLKTKHVVVDPTVTAIGGLFTDRPGTVSPDFAAVADRLPPQVRRSLLVGGLPVPEGKDALYRESRQAMHAMVKLLYDSGVTIVPGTDGLPGFTLHRELELYVQAGIPAADVLRLATLGSAKVAKLDKELGSIEPGKLADLILVDGDPAKSIADIRRTSLVVKHGELYDPAALYRSCGVKPLPST